MDVITAAEADARISGAWFAGYTKTVAWYDAPVALDAFDAEARAEARGDTEYAVFAGGLTVAGTLDLRRDVHSIYVVVGDLRAERVIAGDAVLVVTGRVVARDGVLVPPSEGLFDVAGAQPESDADALLAAIDAPVVAVFDRNRRAYVLRDRRGARRAEADLVPELLDDGDVRHRELRARVLAGGALFPA